MTASFKRMEKQSQVQIVSKYSSLLSDYIFRKKDIVISSLVLHRGVRREIAEAAFMPNQVRFMRLDTSNDLELLLIRYVALDKDSRSRFMMSDGGLGLILFTGACGVLPVHEIEFDLFPEINLLSKDGAIISVREIKASRGLAKSAVSQMSLRLNVLEHALLAILGTPKTVFKRGILMIPGYSRKEDSVDRFSADPQADFDLEIRYV